MANKLKAVLVANTDEKKRDEVAMTNQVEGARIQTDRDILEAKVRLNKVQRLYDATLLNKNFNPIEVVNAKRSIEDAEQDIKDLEALKTELF